MRKKRAAVFGVRARDDTRAGLNGNRLAALLPRGQGTIGGVPCCLIGRHGRKHTVMPTNVNYRANLFALKEAGCTHVIVSTACGKRPRAVAGASGRAFAPAGEHARPVFVGLARNPSRRDTVARQAH